MGVMDVKYLNRWDKACQFRHPTPVICGIPHTQGSVLGPLFFVLYTADLVKIAHHHSLSMHSYADDIQIYGFCNISDKTKLSSDVSACLNDLIGWFASNRLQLNLQKSEFMWCGSSHRMGIFFLEHVPLCLSAVPLLYSPSDASESTSTLRCLLRHISRRPSPPASPRSAN